MISEMLNHFIEQIGEQPLEIIQVMDESVAPVSASFTTDRTGPSGSMTRFTVPASGIYHMKARGAAGMLGSYQRTPTLSYPSDPGHAAIVETDVPLEAGDELLILLGRRGISTRAVSTDGCGGGGGGGTFIFRKLASITDSRYQITISGVPYECLLVAAGGGGTQDNAHMQSTANGYDAAEQLYSLSNFKAFSTTICNPFTSNYASSPMGLSQIAHSSYTGQGIYYTRNNNRCYGGYGCGGIQADGFSYGGGWSKSDTNYRTASWAKEGGTITIATDFSGGAFELSGVTAGYCAWWQPVFNRTAADCVYGNINGSVDSRLLCRLEGNCDFLAYLFSQIHELSVDEQQRCWVVTAWQRQLYLYYAQLQNIWTKVTYIRSGAYVLPDTPEAPEVVARQTVSFEQINIWEKILFDARELLRGVMGNRLVLGTFSAGTNRLCQSIRR